MATILVENGIYINRLGLTETVLPYSLRRMGGMTSITQDLTKAIAPNISPACFVEVYFMIPDCKVGEQNALNACKRANIIMDVGVFSPNRIMTKRLSVITIIENCMQKMSILSIEWFKC